ncbi:MAG TPA: fumarylacetoacetate hydrolase family protein [Caulobacteraceae bacterium]|nr:fumarylacetoacetate hydrolase family protein [Caulobacteraceae bacterium]
MTFVLQKADIQALAAALDQAWRTQTPIAPLSETDPSLDVAGAYEVQSFWSDMRVQRGDRIIGRKIGLTSEAVQKQLGVSEPDYGALWRSNFYPTSNGRVEIQASDFLQPKIEGEVAFLIREDLTGGQITAKDVLAATEACAVGVEIVDSRIADWRIKLVDTIADNASFGGFVLGPWDKALPAQDLAALTMQIHRNGELAGEGIGSAALGNPATATAWLANKLHQFGVTLGAGDIVISGAISKMLPIGAGDEFVFSLSGQPDLTVSFI